MNELIRINNKIVNKEEQQTVSARDLHKFLEITRRFDKWIKEVFNIVEAEENIDYITMSKNGHGKDGRFLSSDYTITLDCAKEIAMVSKSGKSKQIRKYFIEVEKQYRTQKIDWRIERNTGVARFKDLNKNIDLVYIDQNRIASSKTYMKYAKLIGLCLTGTHQGYGDWNRANAFELTLRNDLLSIIKGEIKTGETNYLNIKDKCLKYTKRTLELNKQELPRIESN